MGSFLSKHKHKSRPSSSNSGGGGNYAEKPASNGRTGGYPPIDPREQRQQRPQQYRPQQQQQQRQQYQPAPAPTGQRRPAPKQQVQQPVPQPQTNRTPPKNIYPEYYLEVYCLTCCKPLPKSRHKGKAAPPPRECRITPDLNASLENRAAYRDAWNEGPTQKWRLGIDFCDWAAVSNWKDRAAEQIIKRICRVQDGWDSDDSMAESRFGRIRKTKKEVEERGPFCVDKLLDDLKKRGVDFVSSV